MPLLARRRLVPGQDGIDEPAERAEGRCRPRPGQGVRFGLRFIEGLADGAPRDGEFPGDLPNAEAVAVRRPDGREVVHRTHPSPPGRRGCSCAIALPVGQLPHVLVRWPSAGRTGR